MRSRVLVAVVGVPLVYLLAWASWHGAFLFTLLVAAASTIALNELLQMLKPMRPYVPAGLLVAAFTPLLVWAGAETGIVAGFVALVPLTMVFAAISTPRDEPAQAIAATLTGFAYVTLPACTIVLLRGLSHGFGLLLLLLVGVWMTDTGAFFAGRAFGRHKLAPRLSPNKTIEGFAGGLLVGTFLVWFGHFLATAPHHDGELWISGGQAIVLGLTASLGATVGDLFESLVKRATSVKDSGSLLGEHGGVLDRIDALLVAAPAFYVVVVCLGLL